MKQIINKHNNKPIQMKQIINKHNKLSPMKQIIYKYDNGKIDYKYYINHLNQKNGLDIGYYVNGNIWYKRSYLNDKRFGLDYWNNNNNNKQTILRYYL